MEQAQWNNFAIAYRLLACKYMVCCLDSGGDLNVLGIARDF